MYEIKVALITGANKGLGLEIARQLGRQGIAVVVGARDPDKGEAAATLLREEGIDATAVPLDVTRSADVAALPGFFAERYGRLDILVNNAGVSHGLEEAVSPEILRRILEVNVVGPYAVTETLVPLLQESPAGRIVNHSSSVGSLGRLSRPENAHWVMPAYTPSKAALNALTVVWAQRLRDTPIKVNSAHPGWVKTDLGGEGALLEVEEGARTAVALATLSDDGPTGGFFHQGEPIPW
jgi:NAD(P)-dependent dehydrogenase (short-subunit alcohol dehydrogenase family)